MNTREGTEETPLGSGTWLLRVTTCAIGPRVFSVEDRGLTAGLSVEISVQLCSKFIPCSQSLRVARSGSIMPCPLWLGEHAPAWLVCTLNLCAYLGHARHGDGNSLNVT